MTPEERIERLEAEVADLQKAVLNLTMADLYAVKYIQHCASVDADQNESERAFEQLQETHALIVDFVAKYAVRKDEQ